MNANQLENNVTNPMAAAEKQMNKQIDAQMKEQTNALKASLNNNDDKNAKEKALEEEGDQKTYVFSRGHQNHTDQIQICVGDDEPIPEDPANFQGNKA